MANSADPDQTALKEQSDLCLHCFHIYFVGKIGVQNVMTINVTVVLHCLLRYFCHNTINIQR